MAAPGYLALRHSDGAIDFVGGEEGVEDICTQSQARWRLVWCYERCFKKESEPLRKAIADVAAAAGGSLLCLRKSHKYVSWNARAQSMPFVLLTDWREMKPCIWAMSQHNTGTMPLIVIVLAEDTKQQSRVATWINDSYSHGNALDVRMAKDANHVGKILADLSEKLGSSPKCSSSSEKAMLKGPSAVLSSRVPKAWQLVSTTRSADHDTTIGMRPQIRIADALAARAPIAQQAGTPRPFVKQAAGHWDAKVADVLQPIFPLQTQQQLEEMLLAAMPDTYDD
eukprot:CAMPEP_0115225236 /NCGR_PEP_ID=MMETSP0270-20121206/29997_1 /TAXON_ID=71861 /ORGANISM="Scrippsiella trochoidea, Strain CCMP3099" /LENGTH=281 /DNA_ID=CAMNT_0002639593 /DNA_START=106 /DNA_END=951 /DNA_ORIENTATION=-